MSAKHFSPADLGVRIRTARKNKGFNQEKLSEILGIATSSVGSYEIGRAKPSLDILLKISEICDVELDWLLKGEGPRKVLGEIKEKSQDNGAFGSEVEQQLRERLEEKDKQLMEKDRFIMELLKQIDPRKLGKLKVTETPASVKSLYRSITDSVTHTAKRDKVAV